MIAGVRVQPLFQRTRGQAQACPRAAISTASKSKSVIDWRPKRVSISWTISLWRFAGSSPFFGGLGGGRLGTFQLGIRPSFASLPILLHLLPKLMPLLNLLARQFGLFRT